VSADAIPLTDRFDQALLFARRKHGRQGRKETTVPYISHLMSVAGLVLEAGGDEDLAIAALLHDVIEDCGAANREEIRQRFGDRVLHIVEGCTDTDVNPKPPWRKRKEDYIHHLQTADAETRLVSTADKVHNASRILADYYEFGEAVWERFSGKREGTLWYYRALLEEFKRRDTNRLTRELERVVKELETAVRERAGQARP
jgi:(p)ppGpp synthase/HD superfamily hydrolase